MNVFIPLCIDRDDMGPHSGAAPKPYDYLPVTHLISALALPRKALFFFFFFFGVYPHVSPILCTTKASPSDSSGLVHRGNAGHLSYSIHPFSTRNLS